MLVPRTTRCLAAVALSIVVEIWLGVMGCWWFIRKTPTHGFDCVWVRSILAAVSFTVRGVMVLNLLVAGPHTWSKLVLHSSLADLAAPRAAALTHQ